MPASKRQQTQPVTDVSDETLRSFFGYRMKRAFNVVQADLAETLKPFELRMLTYTALARTRMRYIGYARNASHSSTAFQCVQGAL